MEGPLYITNSILDKQNSKEATSKEGQYMDAQAFFRELDSIPDIPTLRSTVVKINKMLQDYDTSIKELSSIIEKDQAIVAKILRLVNATFYGFRSEIRNIPHAIVVLGFNAVRNAVASVSIIKAFSQEKGLEGFKTTNFWKHSIGVAVTSRYLSEQARLDLPEDCFVAGLLHDLGKVILAHYFTALFTRVWKLVQEDSLSFYEAEEKILPVNHAQIGGHLMEKWNFPATLIDSITYHHAFKTSVPNLNQLAILHTANSIVNRYKAGSAVTGGRSPINPEAKKILPRQIETVSEWFPSMSTEIDSACELFLAQE